MIFYEEERKITAQVIDDATKKKNRRFRG